MTTYHPMTGDETNDSDDNIASNVDPTSSSRKWESNMSSSINNSPRLPQSIISIDLEPPLVINNHQTVTSDLSSDLTLLNLPLLSSEIPSNVSHLLEDLPKENRKNQSKQTFSNDNSKSMSNDKNSVLTNSQKSKTDIITQESANLSPEQHSWSNSFELSEEVDKIETVLTDISKDTMDNSLAGSSIKQSISKSTSRCSYNAALLNKSIDEEECAFQSSLNGEAVSEDNTSIAKNKNTNLNETQGRKDESDKVADISNQNSNMDNVTFKSNILLESLRSSDDFGVGSSDIKFEQAEQIEEVVKGVYNIIVKKN